MASARLGADMSHVICEPDAAQVIKTYSPNLMVHPLLRQSGKPYANLPNLDPVKKRQVAVDDFANASSHERADPPAKKVAEPIIAMLPRLHSLVIGPGLGRDPLMLSTCAQVIEEAKKQGLPFVLDADGLGLVQSHPELVRGYKSAILTPNVVEFQRLAKAAGVDVSKDMENGEEGKKEACRKVAEALGGCIVVQKGAFDYISDGKKTILCDLQGGLKRSGGQGDTLTGSIGTMLAWRNAYMEKIWDGADGSLADDEMLMLAAFGGTSITRECSRLAFEKYGRSLQASHVGEMVHIAFKNLIGEKDSKL
jgi:ATP-dependent NAD(P)H-hydrate dehydratase